MRNTWKLVILGIIALGIVGYFYIFQGHRDIQSETVAYKRSAVLLLDDFQNNTAAATEKYLNKTLEIYGTVSLSDSLTLVLDKGVFFALSESQLSNIGDEIAVKGRCIGYDDLLEEVKIDQARILNQNP